MSFNPQASPVPRLRCQPGGLVDDDEFILTVGDPALDFGNPGLRHLDRRPRRCARIANGRNPHAVTGHELSHGLDPSAVDADLSGANQAVDETARYLAQFARQKIVQALSAVVGVDHDLAHRAGTITHRDEFFLVAVGLEIHTVEIPEKLPKNTI